MTGTVTAEAAELLEQAADRIERHGLCRGMYVFGDSCCMIGAIMVERLGPGAGLGEYAVFVQQNGYMDRGSVDRVFHEAMALAAAGLPPGEKSCMRGSWDSVFLDHWERITTFSDLAARKTGRRTAVRHLRFAALAAGGADNDRHGCE